MTSFKFYILQVIKLTNWKLWQNRKYIIFSIYYYQNKIQQKKKVSKLLELEQELNLGDEKKYKIKAIYASKTYAKKIASQ